MKKLFLIATLVALVTVGLFAAEAGKLTLWCSEKQVDILQELGNEFESVYGIPVDVQEMDFGQIKSKFLQAAPVGEGPDIIVTAHDQIGELVVNGLVEPLEFMTLSDRQDFIDTAINAFEYNGKLYGLPYGVECVALFYNKDYLEEAPTSFEELAELAAEYTDDEFRGFVYNGADFYFTAPLLFSNGGYVFQKTADGLDPTDIGLANEGAIIGAEFFHKLYTDGIMKPGDNYGIADGLFKDGMAMASINGPWALEGYKEAGIDYGIAPIPSINGNDCRPFTGVQGFLVNSQSPNKLFAIDFLANFINTKDVMYKMFMADPRPPARKDVAEMVDDPDVLNFFESAKAGIPMPNIPAMAAVWGSMADALNQIINNELAPADALTQAVAKIEAALE
ncbi:MAG TPA: maltose ABC transporter substrate-binding protein [Thermotogota bacterium]|nr:maltose ABC transporter substrate-binding protein [Thermotogota bacterium]HPJ88271.1 maltose ABC transporter substrate-binding protein [Thermotogota bacterium]HPR96747.1 maltose ABC transporter substrate-binding protein [Thermotogota bacterium]